MACADHPKCHQGHQPQSGTSKSSSTPAKNLQMSSILRGFLISTAKLSDDNSYNFMYRGIFPSSRIDTLRIIQNFSFLSLSCQWHTSQAIGSVNLRLKLKERKYRVKIIIYLLQSFVLDNERVFQKLSISSLSFSNGCIIDFICAKHGQGTAAPE